MSIDSARASLHAEEVINTLCRLLAVSTGVALAAACYGQSTGAEEHPQGTTCTLEQRIPLKVTVHGAGNPDAGMTRVFATDDDFRSELSCRRDSEPLVCNGLSERPGKYLVEVITNDEVVATREVTLREGRCHVVPVHVEF